jgi:uncharacterized membrane protein YjjB (DUF3815 family)
LIFIFFVFFVFFVFFCFFCVLFFLSRVNLVVYVLLCCVALGWVVLYVLLFNETAAEEASSLKSFLSTFEGGLTETESLTAAAVVAASAIVVQ